MTIQNSYIAVAAIVSIALLWWFYVGEYRRYRVDLLRDRLFAIRQRLFDLAVSDEIQFDHPAYGMTRNFLNGMIFMADRFTVPYLSVVLFCLSVREVRSATDSHEERLREAMSALPAGTRNRILELRLLAVIALLSHIAYISPIFFPFACIHRMHALVNSKSLVSGKPAQPLVSFIAAEATMAGRKADCDSRLPAAA